MESKMLDWIKEYFSSTPREQLDKDWADIENRTFSAQDVYHFVEFLENSYSEQDECDSNKVYIFKEKDKDPVFGSFSFIFAS